MKFSDWILIKESSDVPVSGPGIKALQDAMRDMASRGAPTEYNDFGFNKQDWSTYQSMMASGYIDSHSVPARAAATMLRVLSHYQNTQFTGYRQISSMVQRDMASVQAVATSGDKVVVFDRQPLEYGKFKVYIPHGLDRGSTILINRILDSRLEADGEMKSEDKYGKDVYPRFKKMSTDRSSMHTYRIHRSVLDPVLAVLKSKGMLIEYESGARPNIGSAPQSPSTPSSIALEPDVEIIGKEKTDYGNKVAVKFNYEKSKGILNKMRGEGLVPKGISYAGNSKFLINIDDRSIFDKVLAKISEFGLDISPLQEFSKSLAAVAEKPASTERPADSASKEGVMKFTDAADDSMKVKTDVRGLSQDRRDFVRESVQYTFPDYKYDMGGRFYTVSGNYKQYVTFGRLLGKFGYPVDELRAIVKAKLDSGRLSKTEWEGRFDDDQKFMDSIEDKLPDSLIDLYDEQKFGVAFLYGRDHAILGDETGFGKSVQLISAAALRMQSNSKPTLIITLKDTQKQFADEIVRVMGEKEREQISLDPDHPKKWTVTRYSNFSGGKDARNEKVKGHVEALKKAGFGIVIMDELHKVKHGTSDRSKNIASVVENIPTKWGASATVSSNKPMDVKNQLLITGHQLGKVSEPKFKKDFAGMKPTGWGGALEKSDDDEDEIRAAERLNKWLNLSGVYVRREKGQIRKMPELSVKSDTVDLDRDKFQRLYGARVSTYKNQKLAVSKLIAARETVAQLKTDETTRRVLDIVKAGQGKPPAASKVVIFTNFIESGRQLAEKISEGLRSIDPSFTAITYLSDTVRKEREQVKKKFTDDPNIKALVMSMKMGGTGIDFPNASQHMIINDFDWTPESAEQSEGRIYRINTDHPVNIQYVVGAGLDKELFEKVQRKREIAAIIQKYRRDYHASEAAPEALAKIVAAQKEMRKLDDDMAKIVAKELPGTEKGIEESFSSFIERVMEFKEALFPSE